MAGITLQDARNHLAFWLAADRKLSRGEVIRTGDQRMDRSGGETVQERIDYWQRMVNRLSNTGPFIGRQASFPESKI